MKRMINLGADRQVGAVRGSEGLGKERPGMVWRGYARRGSNHWLDYFCAARMCKDGLGVVWLGEARRGLAWSSGAEQGKAR